jgi:hypothetical protein
MFRTILTVVLGSVLLSLLASPLAAHADGVYYRPYYSGGQVVYQIEVNPS